jgi:hypothetical protein
VKKKHPVPSPDEVPRCFGVEYDEQDLGCRRCEVVEVCKPRALQWHARLSIAELASGLESTFTAQREETLQQIYDRLHREIFGTRSRRTLSARNQDAFARVTSHLIAQDIDPATFVAGNMWAMKPWVEKNEHIGFQPTHLQGEKADRRYHAYKGHQSRRFRQQRHTGQTSGTLVADLRQNLFLAEFEVGLAYVRAFVADGVDDWQAAIEEAQPNPDWLAVVTEGSGRRAKRYAELSAAVGALRLRGERQLAQLRAACAVAESYEHDLAHRVGARPFSWRGLAELLARLFPVEDENRDIMSRSESAVDGLVWHG